MFFKLYLIIFKCSKNVTTIEAYSVIIMLLSLIRSDEKPKTTISANFSVLLFLLCDDKIFESKILTTASVSFISIYRFSFSVPVIFEFEI